MVVKDSEKDIERLLVKKVKASGGLCIKLISDYANGLPDRMCLLPGGKIVFVELKSTGQKPRKIQKYMHSVLRGLGFRVEVIDTLAGVENFMTTL